jgi:TfoX/Sxy family transcriptional regulator of competence genes
MATDKGAPDAAAAFAEAAAAFSRDPKVRDARMFGSVGLKVGSKVFAMLVKDQLVVKLPRDRVRTLMEAGVATAFDPGHGMVMREWVSVPAGQQDWRALAREAKAFVAATARSK